MISSSEKRECIKRAHFVRYFIGLYLFICIEKGLEGDAEKCYLWVSGL